MQSLLSNRRLLAMVLGLLVVSGLAAIETLPRQEDPRITARNAQILAQYPGADPEQVEALVVRVLEEELRTIPEIDTINSTAREGVATIAIELADEVDDVLPIWSRVRDRLADAEPELPEAARSPRLIDDRFYAFTMVIALTLDEGSAGGQAILGRYADRLEEQYQALQGTDYTNLFGRVAEEVQVQADPQQLALMGLSADQLAQGLEATDARSPGGVLESDLSRRSVTLEGDFAELSRIRDASVQVRDGQTVRVGDVAEVRKSLADPPAERALWNDQEAIFLGVRMEESRRIDAWAGQMREELARFQKTLPPGVNAEVVFDQSSYTQQRLKEVTGSLLLGLIIVVSLLFLTLGWRGAIMVGLAIPATMLLVLSLFRVAGVNVHQISITGIIVAIGLIVDNAIVVTNSLGHRLSKGDSHAEAIRATLRHFAGPLLASTLTTILAFMPIVLMPGPAGEFVGPLAVAVILALISSYLVALLLIPAGSPMLLKPTGVVERPMLAAALGTVRRVVRLALQWPRSAAMLTIILPVMGVALLPAMPISFFPAADRDQFHIQVHMPAGASIGYTHETAVAMSDYLRQSDEVEDVWFVSGQNVPSVYYNLVPRDDRNPAFAQAIVDTESPEATRAVIERIQSRMSADFPQAQVIARAYEQGPPVAAPLELRLYGPRLEVLAEQGEIIAAIMHSLPEVNEVQTLVSRDRPKLSITPDHEQIAQQGFSATEVTSQLDSAVTGHTGGFLLEGTEQLPVRVRYPQPWRDSPSQLGSLLLGGSEVRGGVPLSAVADIDLVPSWGSINRRDAQRLQIVRGYLDVGALPPDVMRSLEQRLDSELDLPPGYALEVGGEAEERDEAVTRLMSSVVLLVILMFAVVSLVFNSFRRGLIVFFSGAQAFGLGLLALALTGHAFGFIIIVGTMGLVGVAINATIIMIAALDGDAGARRGDVEAMTQVITGSTFRHIGSTTLTTFGGLVPLMLAPGTLWPPFAQTFGVGLLLATLIALVVTPAAYRLACARPGGDEDGA